MESTKRACREKRFNLTMIHDKTGLLFSIVPAVSTDLDTIVSIEQESFPTPWTRLMFEAELIGNPFGRVFVVKRQTSNEAVGGILGYICYWVVFEELRFLNVAVIASVRRQGIGRQLVEFAIQDGIKNETKRALLEVRTSNAVAKKMYERLGFQCYGRRKNYYTNPNEDAILMERTLLDSAPRNTP